MASLLLLLLLATFRGAFPERAIIWIVFLADLVDLFYHRISGPSDFKSLDQVHLVIDSCAFIAVMWVALGANRFWPLPVAALHLLGMTAHFAVIAGLPGYTQVYWAMTSVTDYLQVPIIAIGIIAHLRRSRRIGPYRDWRHDWRVPAFLRQPGQTGAAT